MSEPTKIWFMSSTGRALDVDAASAEPSHIHIARPSRRLRRDNSGSVVESPPEVRDLAAAETTVRAA